MGEIVDGSVVIRGRQLLPTTVKVKAGETVEGMMPWRLVELDLARGQVNNVWVDCDVSESGLDNVQDGGQLQILPIAHTKDSGTLEALLLKDDQKLDAAFRRRFRRVGRAEFPRASTHLPFWVDKLSDDSAEFELVIV
jgi:hypothetical protein